MIYGFHEASLAAAIDQLQSEHRLEVVYWIGVSSRERSFDEDIHQWHLNGVEDPGRRTVQGQESSLATEILTLHFDQIVDQLSRNVVCQCIEPANFPAFILKLANRFELLLREKSVQFLLLQNLPHEGFELVLYLVAKQMGIATLMTYQSVIGNRFFYCFDLQDFGWFNQVPTADYAIEFELPQTFRKDLFYMRGVNELLAHSNRRSLRDAIKRRILFAKITWKVFKQRVGWYDFWKLPQPRIPYEQRYAWELERSTAMNASLERSFVYFPLHLQPELTTSAIGDQYADQLSAIENLSEWLPRKWWLYVKENPKQTHRYRDPQFFERLRRLPNVKLINRTADTYSLLAKCKLAATVTGTVGWEAITGGKRVIVFGRPWYLTLPGVHKWPVVETAESLAATATDHTALMEAIRLLLRKSAIGVVDNAYRESVPEYSAPRNTKFIYEFFKMQLAELPKHSPARGA